MYNYEWDRWWTLRLLCQAWTLCALKVVMQLTALTGPGLMTLITSWVPASNFLYQEKLRQNDGVNHISAWWNNFQFRMLRWTYLPCFTTSSRKLLANWAAQKKELGARAQLLASKYYESSHHGTLPAPCIDIGYPYYRRTSRRMSDAGRWVILILAVASLMVNIKSLLCNTTKILKLPRSSGFYARLTKEVHVNGDDSSWMYLITQCALHCQCQ